MKTKMSLSILVGAGLFALAAPAAAHEVVRDDVRRVHYEHYHDSRSSWRVQYRDRMPRWLRRHEGFRHWYSHSRYKRDRRVSWNHLWEMYRWERRHGYRSYGYRYDYPVDAYRSDRRSKGKAKNKRH